MDNKKKSGIGGIIALCILLVASLSGCIFSYIFFFTTVFASPKDKVMLAFSEVLGQDSLLADISGNAKKLTAPQNTFTNAQEVLDSIKAAPYQGKVNVKIEDITYPRLPEVSSAEGANLLINYKADLENRLFDSLVSFRYGAISVLKLGLYMNDNEVYAYCPNFLDGSIMINTETFGEDLLDIWLFEEYSEYIPEEIKSFNVFDMILNSGNDASLDSTELKEATSALYDAVEVEKTGNYTTYEIDDKDVKCYEYEVTIPAEALSEYYVSLTPLFKSVIGTYLSSVSYSLESNSYYSDYQYEFNGNSYELDQVDELAEDFCEFLSDNARDITIMVYLSDKDTLIAFELETTFKTTDNDVSIDFYGDFTGSKNNTDKVYLDFYIEFGNYSNEFVINSSTKDKKDSIEKETEILLYKDGEYYGMIQTEQSTNNTTGEFDFNLVINDADVDLDVLLFSVKGSVKYENDYYELTIDDITLGAEEYYYGVTSFSLSYSAIYQPLGDESIESPDGPVYEILKLNLNDLYDLLDDIKENIHGTIIGQLLGL